MKKRWIRYLVLVALPALAAGGGIGAEGTQASATATATGQAQAFASVPWHRIHLRVGRHWRGGVCTDQDLKPWGRGTTNKFAYTIFFVEHDRAELADMRAKIQYLEGSPRNMTRCPQDPNLRGHYEPVLRDTGTPMELTWRQRSDPQRYSVTHHIVPISRITGGQWLLPGIYRVRLSATTVFSHVKVDFHFAVMNDTLGSPPRR